MNKKHLVYFGFALATLIGLPSCETSKEVITEKPAEDLALATQVAFKNVASAYLTGNGAEKIVKGGIVINSQAEWEVLTTKMNSVNRAIKDESIDFNKMTVLAYFDKIRGSGGYNVDFVSITEIGQEVQAIVKDTPPEGDAIEIMTQPYSIVMIDKTSKAVTFIEQ